MAKSARRSGGSKDTLTTTAIIVAIAAVLLVAAVVGVRLLWKSVASRPEFKVRPAEKVTFSKTEAEWIRAQEMKQDFIRTSRDANGRSILSGPVSLFERDLAEKVAAAYLLSPWVKRVVSVRKQFPNHLETKLEMRVPYAMVMRNKKLVCLSEDGMLLHPSVYFLDPDHTTALTPIIEVPSDTPPPQPGQEWNDPAVVGGLEMLRLCKGELANLPVTRISIEAQRSSPSSPYMAWLTTGSGKTKGPLVQWGHVPTSPAPAPEVDTPVKVNSILSVFASEGRNFWRFKQIDVRYAQVRCEE